MKSLFDENGVGYRQVGDVQVPNLISTDTNYEIGVWGHRHKEYLVGYHMKCNTKKNKDNTQAKV